ncbi:hypothetical protein SAY86_025982 [Trapa natans]|uniref:Uncharacterized protein n=1 Tax=Trapa natans TaxID=22666 RepID=A0AAN7KF04_TRANT|nr:hypothetical protein SAY86_025982 [Trapa natans]
MSVPLCFLKCLVECHHSSFSFTEERLRSGDPEVMEHFCKVGCSTSLCNDISTQDDPAEVQVSNCVD